MIDRSALSRHLARAIALAMANKRAEADAEARALIVALRAAGILQGAA